ncbi:MAG: MFS transporter [Chloroflexi bacterium]|nr:MFS transporter [Chloroflexota bacterium]
MAPTRLGVGFRWLLASSWITNLGDGIALAAGPLLVASQTEDPLLVAMAALLQWLPQLLLGLYAGALSDRLDRRLIVVTVDVVRAVVLAAIATSIVTGTLSIAVILIALFLLGTAEVFADNSSQTLLPMLVRREDLALANSRVQAGLITVNQLIGPPVGAALFAAGMAWPFVGQAIMVATGALLVSRIGLPAHRRDPKRITAIHQDIAEGFRWVRHHAAVRTLVLTIFTFNITFGAAWSVLVLYATQRLGLGEIGFGLLATVSAMGGMLGTLSYGWITRRVSLGNIMRIGLILETFTHLGLAITTVPAVAMAIFFVFGAHAFVWGTTSVTVRQRAVPRELQGRVGSVNTVGVFGGLVLGSAAGGLLAQRFGITAPFWFAFAGSAVFVVLIWGQLAHIAHDDDPVPQ